MKLLFACFMLGVAFGRPQRNYDEDSSLDDAANNEDIQRRGHLESPARRYPLVDYGGNAFPQQRARAQAQQAATPLRTEQSESGDEVEGRSYRENYSEFRGKSKDHVDRVASPKDRKSSNERNGGQYQFIRDARAKATISPPSAGLKKRTTPTSESGQGITYDVATKLNEDNNANQETNDNLNYSADYEAEEEPHNDSGTNEELLKQMNTVKNNGEPAEYDNGNLGNEEVRKRRDTSSRIIQPELTQSNLDQSTTQNNNACGSEYGETVEVKDELAIKRHLANLSENQISDLLSSLPSDKRVLLQEIIDSDKGENKKREVRKSDGTIQSDDERESTNANVQPAAVKTPDSSIRQLSKSTEADIIIKGSDAIQNVKETSDNNDPEKKINEPQSHSPVADNNIASVVGMQEAAHTEAYAKADIQQNLRSEAAVEKTNNKREIKLIDYNSAIEESEDSSDMDADSRDETNDEDFSAVSNIDDSSNPEALKSKSEMQPIKREVYEKRLLKQQAIKSDLRHNDELTIAQQIEALEASFPNVRSYDDTNYDKEQLVRVKRNKRDLERKKRAAAVSGHDTNVHYRADTEDEDEDEGNEFDDDGFYDKTSNLGDDERRAKLNKVIYGKETPSKHVDSGLDKTILGEQQSKLVVHAAPESSISQDISGIGTDSDNVLSGSEGADEYLMLTSGDRIARDSDKGMNYLGESGDSSQMDDKNSATEELESAQNDHNGAFGGLPKNYDGELSRFKRIRRN